MAGETGFGAGLFLGGVIGVLAGLLLAPKPGEETRAQVVEKTAGLRQRAEEATAGARERVREVVDEGRVMAGRMMPGREAAGAEEPSTDNREEPPA